MGVLLFIAVVVLIIYLVAKGSPGRSAPPQGYRAVEPRPPARESAVPGRTGSPLRPPRVSVPSTTSSWAPPSDAEAARESERAWTPPGRSVEIAGRSIPDGMIYVGEGMRSLRGYSADPALINPHLDVARSRSDVAGAHMGYWPSYSEIQPASRAAYLDWLAGGRRDPKAYVGYVFLFFYGLERRVLFDATQSPAAASELPAIVNEVRELLRVYSDNSSFRGYATAFLNVAEVVGEFGDGGEPLPPRERASWDVPLSVKRAVGQRVAEGRPIPGDWAFAWLRHHPEIQLRTPAIRCPEEFERLFHVRYTEAFGAGMMLKPNKTKIAVDYRPSSSSLAGAGPRVQLDLPDVTRLSGPKNRLAKLADAVQSELDAYSRWVGRNDDRTSPAALAFLPAELISDRMGTEARQFVEFVEQALTGAETAILDAAGLITLWPTRDDGKLSKQEASLMAGFLERCGYGLEPDVRFGGANLSRTERVVVFRATGAPVNPDSLAAAGALLHLGAALATADDEVTEAEERQLEAHLEQGLRLVEGDRVRLRARMRWLLACPPSVASLKKVLADVREGERHRIGRVLLALAGADGHVSPAELKVLGKIYPMLGLDQDMLFADVHEMAASAPAGPVTVLPADEAPNDYRIRSPETTKPTQQGVELDLERIAAIRQETGEVGRVLSAIFAGDDSPGVVAGAVDADDDAVQSPEAVTLLPGLDAALTELVRALAARATWSRAEFEALVNAHGVMAAGAMEIINEAAFAACDEPMLEGTDPIDVNTYAFEEMMV